MTHLPRKNISSTCYISIPNVMFKNQKKHKRLPQELLFSNRLRVCNIYGIGATTFHIFRAAAGGFPSPRSTILTCKPARVDGGGSCVVSPNFRKIKNRTSFEVLNEVVHNGQK